MAKHVKLVWAVLAIALLEDSVVAARYAPALLITTNPLKPRIGKSTEQLEEYESATGPLNRLLFARQTRCPTGYGVCAGIANTCCPLGGKCCTQTDGCCAAGQFCYGTGCCNNADFGCSGSSCCPTGANCCSSGGCCAAGDDCVVVGGQNGCCPAGTTCSGAPTGCSLPGYVPCANENFCCLSGDTCFVDSSGEPGCDGVGGSSAPPASGSGTSPTSISFASPSVTFSPTSSSAAISTGHPYTQSFPNAAPSSSQGVSNSTISATDPRISYSGASWALNTPPCGGTSKRTTTAGDSLTLQFVGTAVYLNSVSGPSAGTYTVEFDQQSASLASVDGFAPQMSGTICDLNWSSFGMEDQLHTITVTYVGASQSGGSAATASFEIANFIVTTSSSGSSTGQSSSGATGVSSSNAKSILNTNGVAPRLVPTFLTIFLSAFIL